MDATLLFLVGLFVGLIAGMFIEWVLLLPKIDPNR